MRPDERLPLIQASASAGELMPVEEGARFGAPGTKFTKDPSGLNYSCSEGSGYRAHRTMGDFPHPLPLFARALIASWEM